MLSSVRMSVKENLAGILSRVSAAYRGGETGVKAASLPRLVAVSKTKPKEMLIQAYVNLIACPYPMRNVKPLVLLPVKQLKAAVTLHPMVLRLEKLPHSKKASNELAFSRIIQKWTKELCACFCL